MIKGRRTFGANRCGELDALFAGQQLAQAIPKNDPSWTILRRRLNPLLYFFEMDSMFDGLADNSDAKLGHRARNVGDDFILPEFGYGECNGLVERIRVYLDRVDDAISIGVRNPAARESHRINYSHEFAFCSPGEICWHSGLETITGFKPANVMGEGLAGRKAKSGILFSFDANLTGG